MGRGPHGVFGEDDLKRRLVGSRCGCGCDCGSSVLRRVASRVELA